MSDTEQFDLQRRRVLLGMAATGAAIAGSSLSCPAMAAAAEQVTTAPRSDKTQDHHDFFGKHQSGIVTPRPACGMLVAFDVLASDREDLERLTAYIPESAQKLMDAFWPGPLSVVLPARPEVPDLLTFLNLG